MWVKFLLLIFVVFSLSCDCLGAKDSKTQLPQLVTTMNYTRPTTRPRIHVKYEPDWKSLDSRPLPQWYDDAKVGEKKSISSGVYGNID